MRKNVASQYVAAQLVSSSDGSAVTTGTTTVYVTVDGGTQGSGAGVIVHEGQGQWIYEPTQAETNGDHVAFTFSNSSAVSTCVNVYPVSFDYTDAVRIGLTSLPNTAMTGTGGFAFTEASELDVNIISISGSSTSADNLETVTDTDWATSYSVPNGQWAITVTGTPDVNVVQVSGSTTAADSMEQVYHTDFSVNYGSQKWQTLADVVSVSGSTDAADNLEIIVDTDFSTSYSTVTNKWQVEADVTAISGDTTSADNLEESTNGIIPFTVQAGTLSTTQTSTNLAEGTDEHYTNSTVIFLTGALAGQRRKITAYTGTGGILTYAAMTEAASAGDTGVIV